MDYSYITCTFSFYWNVNTCLFRVWSPRQAIDGAQILSLRNPPVGQIHNLMSCFDDRSTKRSSEYGTDIKNESPAWTIRLCDVGWRGHQSIKFLKLRTPVTKTRTCRLRGRCGPKQLIAVWGQGKGNLKPWSNGAWKSIIVNSPLTIINYHTPGQTGKTVIDCREEFEQAQNEW